MPGKECPFLVAGSMADSSIDVVPCHGASCQLWDATAENCGLVVPNERMSALGEKLDDLLELLGEEGPLVAALGEEGALAAVLGEEGSLAVALGEEGSLAVALGALAVESPLQTAALRALSATDALLGSVTVDVSAVATTPLYTVPSGKSCVVTRIAIRSANRSLEQETSATSNIGFGAATDLVASGEISKVLTAAGLLAHLTLGTPVVIGTSGQVLNWHNTIGCTTAESTLQCDVFGYLF